MLGRNEEESALRDAVLLTAAGDDVAVGGACGGGPPAGSTGKTAWTTEGTEVTEDRSLGE